MKRTRAITLAVVGVLALSACTKQPAEPTTYNSVAECVSDGNGSELCNGAFNETKNVTAQNAPKFANAEQCAAQFGSCEKSSSGDWFMPAVAGFMLGNVMSGGSRAPATPVYLDRDRRPVAASYYGGQYRPQRAAPTYTARQSARSSYTNTSRASTSSRGGFGGSSATSS